MQEDLNQRKQDELHQRKQDKLHQRKQEDRHQQRTRQMTTKKTQEKAVRRESLPKLTQSTFIGANDTDRTTMENLRKAYNALGSRYFWKRRTGVKFYRVS
ncbi:hypothetical protein HBI71_237020 [Parastagonospora nodorum]|nr:hypothetical protein HBI71_237020 [Parastagonospora nodorum]KAH6205142.1 hypothetical protein HBI43_196310 [Parastagonospora nodorum]